MPKKIIEPIQGTKYDAEEGKPDLSMIPLDVLEGLARAYEYGLIKYTRYDWRMGFDTNRTLAAALRHIAAWQWKGEDFDADALAASGMNIHHIDMAIFNLVCIKHAIMYRPELVKNYKPTKEKDNGKDTSNQD